MQCRRVLCDIDHTASHVVMCNNAVLLIFGLLKCLVSCVVFLLTLCYTRARNLPQSTTLFHIIIIIVIIYFLLFHFKFLSIISNNVDKIKNFKLFDIFNIVTSSNSHEDRADETHAIEFKSIKIKTMTVRGRCCRFVYCLPESKQLA
jgi:hypothetical protein